MKFWSISWLKMKKRRPRCPSVSTRRNFFLLCMFFLFSQEILQNGRNTSNNGQNTKFIWVICGQAFRFLLVQNFVHRWHYLEIERELENLTKPHPSLLNLTKASNFEYFRMVSMLHRLCGKLHRLCGRLHRLCGQLHRLCGRLHWLCGKLHRLCGQTHF